MIYHHRSSLLPAGVHPQHPFFVEADTARVHIEPLSQVFPHFEPLSQVFSSVDRGQHACDDHDNYDDIDYDKEEASVGGFGDGVFGASDDNGGRAFLNA